MAIVTTRGPHHDHHATPEIASRDDPNFAVVCRSSMSSAVGPAKISAASAKSRPRVRSVHSRFLGSNVILIFIVPTINQRGQGVFKLISSTRATWIASRPAPSWIWWRQEVPSATMMRIGGAPCAPPATATVRPSPATRRWCRRHSRSCRPCRSNSNSMVSTSSRGPAAARLSTSPIASNDFWWQWPCSSARSAIFLSGRLSRPAFASRARNSSNSQRARGELLRGIAFNHRGDLVTEAEQATRLQTNHWHAAPHKVRAQRACAPLRFRASSTLPTDRNVRPQHSGRDDLSAGCAIWTLVAARSEHGERGIDVLALEVAIEGIGEQDDVSPCPASSICRQWRAGRGTHRRATSAASVAR